MKKNKPSKKDKSKVRQVGKSKRGMQKTKRQAKIFQKHVDRSSMGDASGIVNYLRTKDLKKMRKAHAKRKVSLENPY